jgi:peptidoglycan/LPS O-acetylase OafA/YrhL
MEGLRGVAVFLVFLVHYVSNVAPWTASDLGSVAAAVTTMGSTGVDLFFVLSGFLICRWSWDGWRCASARSRLEVH